ncbi:MAG: NAD(P)H-dependent oxidoreductase subunit E [Spirochaetes bacterium]|nr:MAG: NAD(P)H-dependent oxidoreductase subunit E [Spirochaetota bacterium]
MQAQTQESIDYSPAERIIQEIKKKDKRFRRDKLSPDYLIPMLQKLQAEYGYLPPEILQFVSNRTGIPLSRMHGVITFYAQFYTEPHGRHTVRCCRGTACHVRGSKKIIDTVKNTLGIDDGETTEDFIFSLETVACLGACALAPVMVVGNTYYGNMTPRKAEQILELIKKEES